MNKEEIQQIYMNGYIDGMHGFDPNPENELVGIYKQLRDFLEHQCDELTDNQRKIFGVILDEFDYILKTGDSNDR